MKKIEILYQDEIPVLKTTDEGQLKGGFCSFTGGESYLMRTDNSCTNTDGCPVVNNGCSNSCGSGSGKTNKGCTNTCTKDNNKDTNDGCTNTCGTTNNGCTTSSSETESCNIASIFSLGASTLF